MVLNTEKFNVICRRGGVALLTTVDKNGRTPLHHLLLPGKCNETENIDLELVDAYLRLAPNVLLLKDSIGYTCLHQLARSKCLTAEALALFLNACPESAAIAPCFVYYLSKNKVFDAKILSIALENSHTRESLLRSEKIHGSFRSTAVHAICASRNLDKEVLGALIESNLGIDLEFLTIFDAKKVSPFTVMCSNRKVNAQCLKICLHRNWL